MMYPSAQDPPRIINAERPARAAPTPNPAPQSRQPKPNSLNTSTNHYRPVVHDRTALAHHADTKVPSSTINQRGSQSNPTPPRDNATTHRRPTLYVRTTPITPASKQADTKVPSSTPNQSTPSYAPPSLSPGGSLSTSMSNVNSHASSTGNNRISLKHDTLEPCDHFRPRRFSKRYVLVDLGSPCIWFGIELCVWFACVLLRLSSYIFLIYGTSNIVV